MNKDYKYFRAVNVYPSIGYLRTFYLDPERNDIMVAPTIVAKVLEQNSGGSFKEIENDLKKLNIKDAQDYTQELFENEIYIECANSELDFFPDVSLNWDFPSIISNAILEVNATVKNFSKIIERVNQELFCDYFLLVFRDKMEEVETEDLVKYISSSTIRSIEIVAPVEIVNWVEDHFSDEKRLVQITYCGCQSNDSSSTKVKYLKNSIELNQVWEQAIDKMLNSHCHILEAHSYHTYFNRKLYIGLEGEIKNSPSSKRTFGNITECNLRDVCTSNSFQELWKVNKDSCDVCKDCEFRYMCIDNRIPIQRAKDEWYFKKECNYNPYICKWSGEEGYKSLSEIGVVSNEEGFTIEEDRINQINEELWN